MKIYPLKNKSKINSQKKEQFSNINEDLTSSSSTTNTNSVINSSNTYFYSTYKTPKKNIITIQQTKNNKQALSSSLGIPNNNIYSKGKIKKSIGTTNNIIINNNTNIINNNSTNIINNNFINSNFNNKDYLGSINQLNMEQINDLKNNKVQFINNIIREKPLLINKNKINQKNYIHIKNNNIIHNNLINSTIKTENNISENKIYKNINNTDYNFTENNYINAIENKNEENSAILNVEEILMIEEKLSSLLNCLANCNPCTEECFECLNFYFTTKLSKNICNYFLKEKHLKIIKHAMNLKLFSFILCYDISLNEDIFPQYIVILDELLGCIHTILILISKYFCNKIMEDNSNIWVNKLQKLINSCDSKKKSTNEIFEEIDILCLKLTDNIFPNILKKYNQRKINEIYNKIKILSQDDLQRLFRDKIFINANINGSIIASSSYFQENKNAINGFAPIPYLKNKSNKKYTLVLDLDETLIHFKVHPNDDSSGTLQFRPFLSEFLSAVKNLYELVIFTAATQDYADPIINAIEQKGIKFDHRLYRIHTILINNDFVKDLSRLGRNLSQIIIVDNMEQNYKLQPDNGITIRPFWGKDINDMALFDLISILTQIVKRNLDVREGIKIFKEEIISKVTSNIFRRVQN